MRDAGWEKRLEHKVIRDELRAKSYSGADTREPIILGHHQANYSNVAPSAQIFMLALRPPTPICLVAVTVTVVYLQCLCVISKYRVGHAPVHRHDLPMTFCWPTPFVCCLSSASI